MLRRPLRAIAGVAAVFGLTLLAAACGAKEDMSADSSAAAMSPAPMMLTDADVAGTWEGTATMEGADSVVAHWTQVCGSGKCAGTSQEDPDTVHSTYTIDADSTHGVSAPYALKAMGGVQVVDHWIARPSGASVSGYGWTVLADKPDSVVMRTRFQGMRK